MIERRLCNKHECLACYDGKCFIECTEIREDFIQDLINRLEPQLDLVRKNNGLGAVGILFGTFDYLKEQVGKQ